jgi:signal transduction histidine kinase
VDPGTRSREDWADLAFALFLASFSVLDVTFSSGWRSPLALNLATLPVAALALAFRRVAPLRTLAAAVVLMSIPALTYGWSDSWSSVFIYVIGMYSAAAYGRHLLAAAAIAASGVAVLLITGPNIHTLGDALWTPSLAILTMGAGLTGRHLRSRSGALDRRAQELERDEERLAAEAAAAERQRIARELHDIVSHSLGVIVLQAGAAERVLDRDPDQARRVLESIRSLGQGSVAEMSTLLGLLEPGPDSSRDPRPTLDDIEPMVARARDAGLDVTFDDDGMRRPIAAGVELSAYRVVQEGLTNVLKHAPGSRVATKVAFMEDTLVVEVRSD